MTNERALATLGAHTMRLGVTPEEVQSACATYLQTLVHNGSTKDPEGVYNEMVKLAGEFPGYFTYTLPPYAEVAPTK